MPVGEAPPEWRDELECAEDDEDGRADDMKHDRRGRGEVADGFGTDVSLRQLDEDVDPDCDRNGREQDQQDGNQPLSEALPGLAAASSSLSRLEALDSYGAVHFLSP